jgi:hypothetical protein
MLFQPVTGESAFSERQRRVTIAIEEIQGALNTLWPGQTADDKRLRYTVMETLFRTRSWTAINAFSAEVVEHGWKILQHFEADAASINVHDEAAVIALIVSCKELEAERTESMVL